LPEFAFRTPEPTWGRGSLVDNFSSACTPHRAQWLIISVKERLSENGSAI
jgi:hypothetical protein